MESSCNKSVFTGTLVLAVESSCDKFVVLQTLSFDAFVVVFIDALVLAVKSFHNKSAFFTFSFRFMKSSCKKVCLLQTL